MLHDGADGINHLLESPAKRSFLPAPRVPLHTAAIEVGAQAGKSNTVVELGPLIGASGPGSSGDQMSTSYANMHAGSLPRRRVRDDRELHAGHRRDSAFILSAAKDWRARRCSHRSRLMAVGPGSADDFVEPLDDLVEDLGRGPAQSAADTFNGKRSDLANLHPGPLWQASNVKLKSQWEGSTLRLVG